MRVGDRVSLLTAKGAQTPFGVTPRMKSYPVTAIFQFGLSDFDQLFVFLPLEEAQAFFNKPGEVSVIEGFVSDPKDMDSMRAKIDATVQNQFMLTDWRQRNKSFFDVLKVESDAIFLILAIIVGVASLLIVQGLILLVKDKTRDIAISAHHGRDARRRAARVHPDRGGDRRGRHGARRRSGNAYRA